MRTVPQAFSALIGTDAPGVTNRVGHHVQGLMRGPSSPLGHGPSPPPCGAWAWRTPRPFSSSLGS
jgi:hypothetical protein